jgi:hypothetical protein
MNVDENVRFYSKRALQELSLAASASCLSIKALHLDSAARYATMRERYLPPHFDGRPNPTVEASASARSKLLLQAAMSRAFLNNPINSEMPRFSPLSL